MDHIDWRYLLDVGMGTAVLAALLQVIAVLLPNRPEWSGLLNSDLTLFILWYLIMITAFFLPMAYVRHTGGGNVLGVILLVVGLSSLVLVLYFDISMLHFFFPKTVVSVFPLYDSVGIGFAGYMMLVYTRREEREKRKQVTEMQSSL